MNLVIQRTGAGPVPDEATQYMVRMRDGVHLATDVYLPHETCPPGPTILTRLPYDKNGDYTFMGTVARFFTERGYRVVVQDVRGKFRSEGETLLFVNEVYDGYDTLDWIVNQRWSDGVVGMWGDSYYGFTQWAAVSSRHPALRAMVPRVTGTRLGELPIPESSDRQHDVEMFVHRTYPLTMFHDRDILDWNLDWTSLPLAQSVEDFFDAVGSRSASFDVWFPHPVALRRFPAGHPFDAPAVPLLMTIGWWDNCAPWQWWDHQQLQTRQAWALNEYLLLEAIDHENNSHFELPNLQPATESASVLRRYLAPAVEFFDVFLRGMPNRLPKVRWQLANSGDPAMRTSEHWPPTGVREITLHLGGGDRALGDAPGGALESVAGAPETVSWLHDATNPVPSPVKNAFAFIAEWPDEGSLADRADVLVFTRSSVEEPVDLVGPVALSATVSSDGPEMDLFARLTDVAPDGRAYLIARGQQTVRHADSEYRVTLDMGQVAYRLPAGHQLRLTVASSDAPEFVPAPGTGEHRWLACKYAPNRQHLRIGGTDGAVLTLSVLEPHD